MSPLSCRPTYLGYILAVWKRFFFCYVRRQNHCQCVQAFHILALYGLTVGHIALGTEGNNFVLGGKVSTMSAAEAYTVCWLTLFGSVTRSTDETIHCSI